MKRLLCIWLPNWPVQRWVVAQPELESRPLVLHARDSRRGQCIAYCAAAARRQGLRPGMSLAEAAAVMRRARVRSESLCFREHDPEADLAALQELATWCEQFSPSLGLESADEPSSLILDVTGSAERLGGETQLVRRVSQAFHQRGYGVVVAVAGTLGAAWAVTHCGHLCATYEFRQSPETPLPETPLPETPLPESPLPETPLPESSPPDSLPEAQPCHDLPEAQPCHDEVLPGCYLVPPHRLLPALRPLPIESLRLTEETLALLHQLGVQTVHQLLQLPRSGLQSRFGDRLLRHIDQATGEISETFTAHHIPSALEVDWLLEHPTAHRDVLQSYLQRLLRQLCQRLQAQDRGAVRVDCRLTLTDGTTVVLQVGLFRPSAEERHLEELVRMQLEQRTIPHPVQQVQLQASVAPRLEHRQRGLLEDMPQETPRQLARLVDRLSGRLGRNTVWGVRLGTEPQVERAYGYVPLTGQHAVPPATTAAARGRHQQAAGLRPLHVAPTPLRLHTGPLPRPAPPPSFRYQDRVYHVQHYWGPERIETDWWRGPLIRRDYFLVEDRQGNRFWLFQDLRTGHWFLHGIFD